MKIANNITELIGNTPLIRLNRFGTGGNAELIAKLESFNPGSSAKDRVAFSMILQAESEGKLKQGTTIIEPTSGNTGVALAYIGARRGYSVILTMPESMSIERRKLLSLLGAKIVLTPASKGMNGAIEKAKELEASMESAWIPQQFDNPANPQVHEKTTAEEIWNDTDGKVDFFVAGVGTGGTLTGVGRALKAKNPQIQIVAVEPEDSAVLSGEKAGGHQIQGIGAGFIPKVLDTSLIDEVITVSNEAAFKTAKQVAKEEGILVGISSGAALQAALELSKREANRGKRIVVFLPDSGERYLSLLLTAEELNAIGSN